jgi:deoxyadenosine/deoxycytidine kinase
MNVKGHIAVEGPIGVGKTSLAELLAERFNARLILEDPEYNPFLPDFYKNRKRFAFQTQIFFLMSRYTQMQQLTQIFFLMSRYTQMQQLTHHDLFSQCSVSDYLFDKDELFARLNLSENELALYQTVASVLKKNIAAPDMVIYLTASVDTMIQRIKKRGRPFEKGFDKAYLEDLCEIYSDFFFIYNNTPLLVVNTDNIDFSADMDKLEYVIERISTKREGTEYISFDSLLTDNREG